MRKLVSIKEVDAFPIYDITVEEDHNFELFNGVIAHNSMYPKLVLPGGTAVTYSSQQIFVISKSQVKEGTDIVGYNFTINIEKSRFVKEKSKLPFTVTYDSGINKYSGLLDIALEGGFVVKPSNGWYSKIDPSTGEILPEKFRAKQLNKEFWHDILESPEFKEFIKRRFQLAYSYSNNVEEQQDDNEELND